MNLNVNEIFYSLQGEGGRTGQASIFIRLAKCNLDCSFCDTDFERGVKMTADELLKEINRYGCKWIIWTGGEPALQLTNAIVTFLRKRDICRPLRPTAHGKSLPASTTSHAVPSRILKK